MQDEVAHNKTVSSIIENGVKAGASDIHIEPRENAVVVRYRVDGLLREADRRPRKLMSAVVSRIKTLSNLKPDERRAPQDGRFKMTINGQVYTLRVSILPILDGEKVALHILNEASKPADFNELGLWGAALSNLQQAIVEPQGMVLMTGPAGAGKSTTLFSVLSQLNTPHVNIATVEDPVEYHIAGANQTQVNPAAGMTFGGGLRAMLRQDPNIIMVGEIRDRATADLAVQAALTGHLVFSTLHTNNAGGGLARLLSMGVEPFLITSAVRLVIAQRLVRRLCPVCREAFAPDSATVRQLEKSFRLKDNGGLKHLHGLETSALQEGIGKSGAGHKDDPANTLSTSNTAITRLWRARENGCDNCTRTGYKGRTGIYEALDNSEAIQKLIVAGATSETIEKAGALQGMLTMQLDGLVKALRGQTSIEEVLRVTSQK